MSSVNSWEFPRTHSLASKYCDSFSLLAVFQTLLKSAFAKPDKRAPYKHSYSEKSFKLLKKDSILQLAACTLCLAALAASFCRIVVSRWVLDVPLSRWFRVVISLVRASYYDETAEFPNAAEIRVLKMGPFQKPSRAIREFRLPTSLHGGIWFWTLRFAVVSSCVFVGLS